ncbi:restriction endonuclease [Streptococcus cuniculi]|uniref:Restriction endonuclease n=1 Tax=Streptococcus cuniculi TaxID=1432788 RepID=A0A4Y9JAW4_9STRE|nr:restriction endonuclease [Streptococcus cuniculi]MBF0777855.1 restriction endonuclease [Streptococcus cuniculi]TFU98153.1 restriction endonuclease [Streptococcus cuniculi]
MNFKKFFSTIFQQTKSESPKLKPDDFTKKYLIDYLLSLDTIYKNKSNQGLKFEYFIQILYELAGYQVEITDKSKEVGVDIIAKDNEGQIIFIQCKHHSLSANTPKIVGISDIQKFNGIPGANKKVFITTSFFTGNVNSTQNDYPNIEFIDRKGLLQFINQIVPDLLVEYIFLNNLKENNIKECYKCHNGYIIKKYSETRNYYFYACTNYPNCDYKKEDLSNGHWNKNKRTTQKSNFNSKRSC